MSRSKLIFSIIILLPILLLAEWDRRLINWNGGSTDIHFSSICKTNEGLFVLAYHVDGLILYKSQDSGKNWEIKDSNGILQSYFVFKENDHWNESLQRYDAYPQLNYQYLIASNNKDQICVISSGSDRIAGLEYLKSFIAFKRNSELKWEYYYLDSTIKYYINNLQVLNDSIFIFNTTDQILSFNSNSKKINVIARSLDYGSKDINNTSFTSLRTSNNNFSFIVQSTYKVLNNDYYNNHWLVNSSNGGLNWTEYKITDYLDSINYNWPRLEYKNNELYIAMSVKKIYSKDSLLAKQTGTKYTTRLIKFDLNTKLFSRVKDLLFKYYANFNLNNLICSKYSQNFFLLTEYDVLISRDNCSSFTNLLDSIPKTISSQNYIGRITDFNEIFNNYYVIPAWFGSTQITIYKGNFNEFPTSILAESIEQPNNLHTYPNPAFDVINISDVLPETYLELSNLFGEKVWYGIGINQIYTKDLPIGAYILKTMNGEQVSSSKIVVWR